MKNTQPIFNAATHYRIEVQGPVDVAWLQSFDGLAQINADETAQTGEITVLDVQADQSGIVGLVRRLHGLGMTILKVQVVAEGGRGAAGEA